MIRLKNNNSKVATSKFLSPSNPVYECVPFLRFLRCRIRSKIFWVLSLTMDISEFSNNPHAYHINSIHVYYYPQNNNHFIRMKLISVGEL